MERDIYFTGHILSGVLQQGMTVAPVYFHSIDTAGVPRRHLAVCFHVQLRPRWVGRPGRQAGGGCLGRPPVETHMEQLSRSPAVDRAAVWPRRRGAPPCWPRPAGRDAPEGKTNTPSLRSGLAWC